MEVNNTNNDTNDCTSEQPQRPSIVYYGSTQCQGMKKNSQRCTNNAYYRSQDDKYVCGVHSSVGARVELPKNSNAKNEKMQAITAHQQTVLDAASANRTLDVKGGINCYKMKMMKEVPLVDGWRNVFPNNKHQNRTDGYGCAELSPMQLGPVLHCQPDLPPAMNIENYHQANKVWCSEIDQASMINATRDDDYRVSIAFYTTQVQLYNDKVAHRHKYDSKTMKRAIKEIHLISNQANENTTTESASNKNTTTESATSGYAPNKNAPLFSIHKTVSGEERRFTYVQSRYFYCRAYEILAKRTQSYRELCEMHDGGINMIICGYDARPVSHHDDIHVMYADPQHPFGHELVLYSLLTITDSEDYPWNRYARQHADVYDGVACMVG